jgi:hypothetical protein
MTLEDDADEYDLDRISVVKGDTIPYEAKESTFSTPISRTSKFPMVGIVASTILLQCK